MPLLRSSLSLVRRFLLQAWRASGALMGLMRVYALGIIIHTSIFAGLKPCMFLEIRNYLKPTSEGSDAFVQKYITKTYTNSGETACLFC